MFKTSLTVCQSSIIFCTTDLFVPKLGVLMHRTNNQTKCKEERGGGERERETETETETERERDQVQRKCPSNK